MTKATTRKPKQPAPDNAPAVPAAAGEPFAARRQALLAHSPVMPSAATANAFARIGFGATDLAESVGVLVEQVNKIKRGDLGDVEAMLYGQASALHSIFDALAGRAEVNMGTHLGATETYLRLALKAQAQCRATLETLAELKNPRPVAFVKQANIAHGHQQVNNGAPPAARAREHQNRRTNYQERMAMSYYRTPEHRALQAQRIREWRPWERSTGPKTEAGKAAASGNAWKGGTRAALREIAVALRELRNGDG